MKNLQIEVKNKELINIHDSGKESTVLSVTPKAPFMLSKRYADDYMSKARKLLNELSKDYNNVGIDGIIAAMLIETMGNENYGDSNL